MPTPRLPLRPPPTLLTPFTPRRPLPPPHTHTHTHHQTRHATLIPRPHRPYTFTQLLTLSDGSTFLHRTTSPSPVYRSTRDTRNTPLWNPSNQKLANVEEDEAGRLRAFRRRFGRGWDAETRPEALEAQAVEMAEAVPEKGAREQGVGRAKGREDRGGSTDDTQSGSTLWDDEPEDNLMDLIGSYGREAEPKGPSADATALKGPVKKPSKRK